MNRVWIDPPSGWQYGFPKLYDKKVPLAQWLIDNGYPEADTDFAMQYIRTWPEATDETVVN
jgi:hypothetical protein